MSESVRQNLPATDGHVTVHLSAEQLLVIREAAELIGWTVTDYILSAALDRAERNLYEHATAQVTTKPPEAAPAAPYTALLLALT